MVEPIFACSDTQLAQFKQEQGTGKAMRLVPFINKLQIKFIDWLQQENKPSRHTLILVVKLGSVVTFSFASTVTSYI